MSPPDQHQDVNEKPELPEDGPVPVGGADGDALAAADERAPARTRRVFLGLSARKLAYAAPLVLLIKPKPACASGMTGVS